MLAASALLVTGGCSSDAGGPSGASASAAPSGTAAQVSPSAEETPPAKGTVTVVRTVAEGLNTPWGLAPLPEGGLLVASRDEGTITRVDAETVKKTELGEVPGVSAAA